MTQSQKRLTGWHVAGMFVAGFSVIIGVNIALAVNAVRTFPGLEVKNSYVASQEFNQKLDSQLALNWHVDATVQNDALRLSIMSDGKPVDATIINAIFGRATHVANDQSLSLVFDGQAYVAPVVSGAGNWNLRLLAKSQDGVEFQQRVIVKVLP